MKEVVNYDYSYYWFYIDGSWRHCIWLSDSDGIMHMYIDGEEVKR